MDLAPLPLPIRAPHLPLERLAANSQVPEVEKIVAVSQAFEAILIRQILQSAQKTVFPSKLVCDSAPNGIYQDMLVNQLADGIAKSGGLGLAQSLATELQRQHPPQTKPTA